jgi:hypothetical protein
VLSEPDHVGAIYELAGPEILTPSGVASILGKILGRGVRAEKTSIDAWKKRSTHLDPYQIEALTKMFAYYDQHGLWGNPRALNNLLHHAPTSFEEFARGFLQSELRK